jgi:hypothetical protein
VSIPVAALIHGSMVARLLELRVVWICMDFSVFWVLCVVRERSLRQADHSSRGVTPNVICLSVVEETHRRGLGPLGLSNNKKIGQY